MSEGACVAFFGRKGSGKSTAASVLGDREGWHVLSIAAPLKRMVLSLPGVTDAHVYGGQKEEVLPLYGCTARHLMQTLGVEWGRAHVAPDVWLRLWQHRADKLLRGGWSVVCDDGRLPNELERFRALGVRCVRVRRAVVDSLPPRHSSEHLDLLDDNDFDAVIENDGTHADLRRQVESLGW